MDFCAQACSPVAAGGSPDPNDPEKKFCIANKPIVIKEVEDEFTQAYYVLSKTTYIWALGHASPVQLLAGFEQAI